MLNTMILLFKRCVGFKSLLLCFVLSFSISSWGISALEQLNSSRPYEKSQVNQLTLLTYSAGEPLVWNSPGQLVRSVVWNTVTMKTHPLAHVDVFLRCNGQEPMLSGMSRVKTWDTYKEILFLGASLKMLTAVFPGRLLENATIMEYLKPAIENGNVRAISFDLNEHNCKRLMSYFKEYKQREYHKKYSGFASNVYAGEGAGCAAYAMSFLQVADLLEEPFRSAWSRQLKVPLNLTELERKPPSVWSYLLGFNSSWASERDNESTVLTIYDPEQMYQWIGDQYQQPFLSAISFTVEHAGKAIELRLDGKGLLPAKDYWQYTWPY